MLMKYFSLKYIFFKINDMQILYYFKPSINISFSFFYFFLLITSEKKNILTPNSKTPNKREKR